jgi:hypothetical protein
MTPEDLWDATLLDTCSLRSSNLSRQKAAGLSQAALAHRRCHHITTQAWGTSSSTARKYRAGLWYGLVRYRTASPPAGEHGTGARPPDRPCSLPDHHRAGPWAGASWKAERWTSARTSGPRTKYCMYGTASRSAPTAADRISRARPTVARSQCRRSWAGSPSWLLPRHPSKAWPPRPLLAPPPQQSEAVGKPRRCCWPAGPRCRGGCGSAAGPSGRAGRDWGAPVARVSPPGATDRILGGRPCRFRGGG